MNHKITKEERFGNECIQTWECLGEPIAHFVCLANRYTKPKYCPYCGKELEKKE